MINKELHVESRLMFANLKLLVCITHCLKNSSSSEDDDPSKTLELQRTQIIETDSNAAC